MNTENLIPIEQLCAHYELEISFFDRLDEFGLLEIHALEAIPCIHHDQLLAAEKIIRLHRELNLNFEAIDVVFNLLEKVDRLQNEVYQLKARLAFYEP